MTTLPIDEREQELGRLDTIARLEGYADFNLGDLNTQTLEKLDMYAINIYAVMRRTAPNHEFTGLLRQFIHAVEHQKETNALFRNQTGKATDF